MRENAARAETSGRVQTDLDPELGRVRRRGKRGGRAWRPGDQDARRVRVKKASSQMSGLYKEQPLEKGNPAPSVQSSGKGAGYASHTL